MLLHFIVIYHCCGQQQYDIALIGNVTQRKIQ